MSERFSLEATLRRRYETVDTTIVVGGRSYRVVRPRSVDDLIDVEAFNRDERIPYWADVWPSARVLASRVATWQGAGRTLLDLGCGLGFISTVAAAAGFHVTATDYYAEALQFVRLHARLNGLPAPATLHVDWRSWPDDAGRFDVVVGSDVLYEPAYPQLIAAVLSQTLSQSGEAWIADPGRRHAERFEEECRNHDLTAETHDVQVFREGVVEQTVNIYRVTQPTDRATRASCRLSTPSS